MLHNLYERQKLIVINMKAMFTWPLIFHGTVAAILLAVRMKKVFSTQNLSSGRGSVILVREQSQYIEHFDMLVQVKKS